MKVDEDLGTIHVTRVVSAVAGGRILNPKTARSQVLGGVVWGIGMALEEESVIDHTSRAVHEPQPGRVPRPGQRRRARHRRDLRRGTRRRVNPLGAKGLGEIGIVGVAAAIANAVFHATGKRVRDLPITLDKLCCTGYDASRETIALQEPAQRFTRAMALDAACLHSAVTGVLGHLNHYSPVRQIGVLAAAASRLEARLPQCARCV